VGPRALTEAEVLPAERAQWRRWEFRPGVLNLWWIRQRANIAFGTEWETDAEYARTQSVGSDAGMIARALPGLLYGGAPTATSDEIHILGHRIDNLSMTEALNRIRQHISSGPALQISFLNADCVNRAWTNSLYKRVLNESDLTLADGIGLKLAGRILKRPVRQNVNGTDLFPRLCEQMDADGSSLFLLGARPGVPEAVAAWVTERYPGVRIAGTRHGYFTPAEEDAVLGQIANANADVLLVAFGAPRQDCWIAERLPIVRVKVAMGVGGLFDFYSGRLPRAPMWMREMGLEWLYRFIQEPGRMWRRYFGGNFLFLYRVFRQRLRGGL
jgi:N-acetylglucosaminyldiphosphoundecaprenol N-acetyl-beta-D-mannosaminyltransferase